jgi:hypothetical protein
MKRLFVLPLAVLFAMHADAQYPVRCHTVEMTNALLQQEPSLAQIMADEESKEQQWLNDYGSALPREVVTIPVVVHIVYLSPVQNISDNVVLSQIDVLNECFRKTNPDWSLTPAVWSGLVADCEIQFCLASQDPAGNATNGITRTSTTVTSFSLSDNVKKTALGGIDAWPTEKYLNIWVCNLESGILGYAQLPTLFAIKPTTDGVAISYKGFGTLGGALYPQYAGGKTTVHEIGHWLGLRHIWGDDGDSDNGNNNTSAYCSGSDAISDTPNSSEATFNCPVYPLVDGCTTSDGKMFMNYMDYSDDDCLYMFTEGQKTKMVSVINTTRIELKSSQACWPVGIFEPPVATEISVSPNPSTGVFQLTCPVNLSNKLTIEVFNQLGQLVTTMQQPASSSLEFDLRDKPEGIYLLRIMSGDQLFFSKVILEK